MRISSTNTSSEYRCVGLGKFPPLSSGFRKPLTPSPSPDGMKDGDGSCGPYVPPSKNLQAETNIDYRNDDVDWFSFGGFGDGSDCFFGIHVDLISYLILRKFALL